MSNLHTDLSAVPVSVAPSSPTAGTTVGVTDANAANLPDIFPWWGMFKPSGAGPTRSNSEIVKVTAKSSSAGTTTFTITRAQGIPVTTARTVAIGDDFLEVHTAQKQLEVDYSTPSQGALLNGEIVTSVASNNLTVAIKTLAGNDASTTEPIFVRIGNTLRKITAALSVTKNAGTNWFTSGSAELATQEVDYFVYLGYNATDGVVLGFSPYPTATKYGDFSTTTTNDYYAAISTITNATSTDVYEVIGRFNAILSATASFNWSIPATSIIISRPIFNTRTLIWTPAYTGFSANPVHQAQYDITLGRMNVQIDYGGTLGTSNTTAAKTMTLARVSKYAASMIMGTAYDNGADQTLPSYWLPSANSKTIAVYKTLAAGLWTGSGGCTFKAQFFLYT